MLLCERLLNQLDNKLLEQLVVETKADEGIRKLDARTVFSLIMYSLLESDKISLRSMSETFEQVGFRTFIGTDSKGSTGKSSLSDRLSTIPQEFFAGVFYKLVEKYSKLIAPNEKLISNKKVIIFDSTFLTFGYKLLQNNFTTIGGNKKQVKLTVAYSIIPKQVRFHHDKSHRSEDISLRQSLLEYGLIEDEIAVFDRGLQSRKSFVEFDNKNIDFVTRLNDKAVYETREVINDVEGKKCNNLSLTKDIKVYLNCFRGGKIKHEFRVIEGINDQGKTIRFLTNMFDISSEEVISIYKYRWQIEIFFKQIKQNLQAKHFISYSQNGIAVFIYMIMITTILISIFQIEQNLKYWVEAKRMLCYQLKVWLIRDILKLFDGNLQKFDEYIESGGKL